MITRTVRDDDLRNLAKVMRRAGVARFRTRAALIRYLHSGYRQIVVTHDEKDGRLFAVTFFHLLRLAHTVVLDMLVLECEDAAYLESVALEVRRFLGDLLDMRHCAGCVLELHEPTAGYVQQLKAVGFLRVHPCKDCLGGMFTFSLESAHVGAVVIERVLGGDTRVFGEV